MIEPYYTGHGVTLYCGDMRNIIPAAGLTADLIVIRAQSMHHRATHPTQKPLAILAPLLEYGCPPAGLVLDPFAGSGSTAAAAIRTGRRAVLVESREDYCEAIASGIAAPGDARDWG